MRGRRPTLFADLSKLTNEQCVNGHIYALVGVYVQRRKNGSVHHACKACKKEWWEKNKGKRPTKAKVVKRKTKLIVLPATDERAINFRTEAKARGIKLDLCV